MQTINYILYRYNSSLILAPSYYFVIKKYKHINFIVLSTRNILNKGLNKKKRLLYNYTDTDLHRCTNYMNAICINIK